jgi:hypothetical protein
MATPLDGKSAYLMHLRMAHLSWDGVKDLPNKVDGANVNPADVAHERQCLCDACLRGKMHRLPFPDSSSSAKRVNGLLHSDIAGPLPDQALGGYKYYMTVLDDYSKVAYFTPFRHKSEVKYLFKAAVAYLERQAGEKVQIVRTDNGSEYVNEYLSEWFESQGIKHERTVAYTPQQNGVAERFNRTMMDKTRAVLIEANLSMNLWAEIARAVCYIYNRSPKAGLPKTPIEMFTGDRPSVAHLRILGCEAYVHVPKEKRNKLQPTAQKGICVGYLGATKGWKVLVNGKIVVSRDVVFDEAPFLRRRQAAWGIAADDDSPDQEELGDVIPGTPHDSDDEEEFHTPSKTPATGTTPAQPAARPVRTRTTASHFSPTMHGQSHKVKENKPNVFVVQASDIPIPASHKEAMGSTYKAQWEEAELKEITSILENDTYEMVRCPAGVSPLKGRWVLDVKSKADGSLERFKARFVVKGFMQKYGVDYFDTAAPVSKMATTRAFLANAHMKGWRVTQLDISTAFLNGVLEEEIYVECPEGFEGPPGCVWKLKKALYGLKQAPRAWYETMKSKLIELGFRASEADPSLFILETPERYIMLLCYVDDLLIAAPKDAWSEWAAGKIGEAFKLRTLGEASYFLGIELLRTGDELKLVQSRKIKDLLDKYGLAECNPRNTPMTPGLKLTKEGTLLDKVEYPYPELVGSLLYLSNTTRPDIAQAVNALARFMQTPTTDHWEAAKGVLRYLAGTINCGLVYKRGDLIGFCDADYAGDVNTRRSTSGWVFIFGGAAFSWSSKIQPTVAVSTAEAEYMAAAYAIKEALWLRKLFAEFRMVIYGAVTINCDNQAALCFLRDPIVSPKAKHIAVNFYFAREHVALNEVDFVYVPTASNVADIFTKSLPVDSFRKFREGMGMR